MRNELLCNVVIYLPSRVKHFLICQVNYISNPPCSSSVLADMWRARRRPKFSPGHHLIMLVTIHDENNHIDDVDESDHMLPTLLTCFILSSIESMTMKAPVRPTPALKRKNVLKNHHYHNHEIIILTVIKLSSPSAIIYYSSPAVGHYRTRVRGVQHVNPKNNIGYNVVTSSSSPST